MEAFIAPGLPPESVYRQIVIYRLFPGFGIFTKLLMWEQYIVSVSGKVQRRCPRQFLDSGVQSQAHGQAQRGIQVQPVQYIRVKMPRKNNGIFDVLFSPSL